MGLVDYMIISSLLVCVCSTGQEIHKHKKTLDNGRKIKFDWNQEIIVCASSRVDVSAQNCEESGIQRVESGDHRRDSPVI